MNLAELENSKPLPGGRIQQFYEKYLFPAAILLLEFHMLHCLYRYVAANYRLYTRVERWLGLVLFAAVAVCLLAAVFCFSKAAKAVCFFQSFSLI